VDPKFNIQIPGASTDNSSLFVQLNFSAISFLTIDAGNKITSLVSYDFPSGINELTLVSFLKEIFNTDTLLQKAFKKIDVVFAFSTALLIPYEFHNNAANKAMFELVYGDTHDNVLKSDLRFQHDFCNIYEVPRLVNSIVTTKFPTATFTHQYSLLPDIIKQSGSHLYAIFGEHDVTAMLLKEGKIQIIQNFKFTAPEDVTYYLLGICENFGLNINETVLHLNGNIATDSDLYKEIDAYFLQVEYAILTQAFNYADELKQYPAHLFSHLFATASCV
jgi:hypothetical protein